MRAYALIQHRSGAKNPADEAIPLIAGHPLLAYSVAFARETPVERVLLSTDSPRHAEIGLAYGAEVPRLRAAGGGAGEADILADLETALPARGIPLPDIWVWLDPVHPFRAPAAIAEAIAVLRDRAEVDAVRLVSRPDARLHRIDPEGWLEASDAPAACATTGVEVFRHASWRSRSPSSPRQRVHPLAQPRITALAADSPDGTELVRALLESWPRPAIVAKHVQLPEPLPPLATPAPGVAQLRPHYDRSDPRRQIEILCRLMLHEAKPDYSNTAGDLARARPDLLRTAAELVLSRWPLHPVALHMLALTQLRLGDFAAASQGLRRFRDTTAPLRGFDKRKILRASLLDTRAEPAQRVEDWARHGAQHGALSACSYAVQRAVAEAGAPDLSTFEAQLAISRRAMLAEAESAAMGGDSAARAFVDIVARLQAARSVAIVGNADTLRGSLSATRIEAHDLVVRCNFPVIADFEADVGTRTDLMLFDSSIRGRLVGKMARHANYAEVPALCFGGGRAPPGTPDLPSASPSLMRVIGDVTYACGTTGFRGISLISLILDRPAELFGFTFFPLGRKGDYFEEIAPAVLHEMAYERWFVERVLPVLRPRVRWVQPT